MAPVQRLKLIQEFLAGEGEGKGKIDGIIKDVDGKG